MLCAVHVAVATKIILRCLSWTKLWLSAWICNLYQFISIPYTYIYVHSYDSVKQPKKQWELFSSISSCEREFGEGSIFWPELNEQRRSLWRFQTGLAGAIFLLCISCVKSCLKNFQLTFFFLLENVNSWKSTSFMGI